MYDTAFMGEPASVFFDGKAVFCDALSLYFTDYEPGSCFVAETAGEIVGCLLGAKNKIAAEKIISGKIAPRLFWGALAGGVLFRKKNIIFILNVLSGIIQGEFKAPDFTNQYPATLHINVKQGYRGLNIGSRLIAAYLGYLREEKIPGVCFATISEGAGKFFSGQGFQLLHSGKRSYFHHILHKDISVYIYGKIL